MKMIVELATMPGLFPVVQVTEVEVAAVGVQAIPSRVIV
jgi:hypothetical protein